MRIGLISDTHIPQAGRDPSTGLRTGLWPQVYEALRGVDLIMHAGDLLVPEVIDWLERLAPVMAVSGNGDYGGWERRDPPKDPRLSESRVLALDGPDGRGPSAGSGRSLLHPAGPEADVGATFRPALSEAEGSPVGAEGHAIQPPTSKPLPAGRRVQPPVDLPSKGRLKVRPGDRLTIETPGGGGWG